MLPYKLLRAMTCTPNVLCKFDQKQIRYRFPHTSIFSQSKHRRSNFYFTATITLFTSVTMISFSVIVLLPSVTISSFLLLTNLQCRSLLTSIYFLSAFVHMGRFQFFQIVDLVI